MPKHRQKLCFEKRKVLQKHGKRERSQWPGNRVSKPNFYNWKAKYNGMTGTDIKRRKELEEKNSLFKRKPPVNHVFEGM